jgi:hypothetical protein
VELCLSRWERSRQAHLPKPVVARQEVLAVLGWERELERLLLMERLPGAETPVRWALLETAIRQWVARQAAV